MKLEINRLEMLKAVKNTARVAPMRAPVDVLNAKGTMVVKTANEVYVQMPQRTPVKKKTEAA